MDSVQGQSSYGSEADPRYAMVDERKRKRMMSNRESARRSRMRKQKQLEGLVNDVSMLQNERSRLAQIINEATQRYIDMESTNNVLRAQAMELTDRLRSLNSVLQIVEEVGEMALEITEVPDPMLKPWQVPCSVNPIMASADMFQC